MNDSAVRAVHPMPGLAWTDLRRAAVELAGHGWPVLPGTYQLARHSAWLGKPQAHGLEPVAGVWTMAATTDPDVAIQWWTTRPYSVLLSCGITVDAVEFSSVLAEPVCAALRAVNALGPIAVTPYGQCLLFVRADILTHDTLDLSGSIVWHRNGSWVPLPPTCRADVAYRWRISPQSCQWRLPSGHNVRTALVPVFARPQTS